MNKFTIGTILIVAGTLYSLTSWDLFYNLTLGKLVEWDFIKPPQMPPGEKSKMGRKAQIIAYGLVLIGIGFYIIFLSNI